MATDDNPPQRDNDERSEEYPKAILPKVSEPHPFPEYMLITFDFVRDEIDRLKAIGAEDKIHYCLMKTRNGELLQIPSLFLSAFGINPYGAVVFNEEELKTWVHKNYPAGMGLSNLQSALLRSVKVDRSVYNDSQIHNVRDRTTRGKKSTNVASRTDVDNVNRRNTKNKLVVQIRNAFNQLCRSDAEQQALWRELGKELGYSVETEPHDETNDRAALKASLPTVAPQKWEDRPSRRSISPIEFLKATYGEWLDKGLVRTDLRDLDKPLYLALSKWLQREQEHGRSVPDDLRNFFAPKSEQVDRELEQLGIKNPTDAYARFPNDRNKADRLYQAALRRAQDNEPS